MNNLKSIREMRELICRHHYTHSIPSGDNVYCQYKGAIVIFSRPANNELSRWLLGGDNLIWELSRMWAADGHEKNLLTEAISRGIKDFLKMLKREAIVLPEAIISFADPNAGHIGKVYQAASWVYLGQSDETRCYLSPSGEIRARRSFHSGGCAMTKIEIESLGFVQLNRPGKHRFAKGLSRWSRDKIQSHAARPKDKTQYPSVVSKVQPLGAAPIIQVEGAA